MGKAIALVLALVTACVAAFPGNAAARASHYVELGLLHEFDYRYDYDEDPGLLSNGTRGESTEEGWLTRGFRIGYGFHGGSTPIQGRVFFEYADDDTDFEGTLQDGTPAKGETDNKFITWEGDVGFTIKLPAGFGLDLTPYVGLGYRYWERGLGGAVPFTEEYSWAYIPVGARLDYRWNEKWSVGLDLALKIMIDAKIKVHLSDFLPGFDDPELDLGNKTGYKVQVPVRYDFTRHWSAEVSPWYEYSALGRSDVLTTTSAGWTVTVSEPSSETRQYGVGLRMRFLF